jgi:tRNA (adenine57-N1/adenine58-N1)-methyltransferase catalytic subunit
LFIAHLLPHIIHFHFPDVTMYESLLRPHDVAAVSPLPSIAEAAARLKAQEVRKEEKRLLQIAASRARNEGKTADSEGKRKRDGGDIDGVNGAEEDAVETLDAKKAKTEPTDVDSAVASGAATPTTVNDAARSSSKGKGRWKPVPSGEPRLVVSKPFAEVRGHTSYLTFAMLVPPPMTTGTPFTSVVEESAPGSSNEDATADEPAAIDTMTVDST